MAPFELPTYGSGRGPGHSIIATGSHKKSQSFPAIAGGGAHAVEMIDYTVAIVENTGAMHVAIGCLEKLTGGIPAVGSLSQAACEDC